jgi:hypothetical protein
VPDFGRAPAQSPGGFDIGPQRLGFDDLRLHTVEVRLGPVAALLAQADEISERALLADCMINETDQLLLLQQVEEGVDRAQGDIFGLIGQLELFGVDQRPVAGNFRTCRAEIKN